MLPAKAAKTLTEAKMKWFGIFLILMAMYFLDPILAHWLARLGIGGVLYKVLYLGFFVAGGILIGAIWNPNPR